MCGNVDRTGIVIEIFQSSRSCSYCSPAVDIARLNYLVPRLREVAGGDKERQMGQGAGGNFTRAESRRNVRDQIAALKRELDWCTGR